MIGDETCHVPGCARQAVWVWRASFPPSPPIQRFACVSHWIEVGKGLEPLTFCDDELQELYSEKLPLRNRAY